jgi:hypothetical protein
MINLDRKSFDKERIKSRILKKAADIWGYKEGEMESFDPLVKLLIEAFAGEFEKISYEISETQLRVIERLTGLISPDLDIVKPSFAIIQTRAVDSGTTVTRDAQFLLKKAEDRSKPPADKESMEVFLSPADEFPVLKGSILYYVAQRNIFNFENGTKRVLLVEKDGKDFEEYNTLWLGLDLEDDPDLFNGISFFFDWFNEPQKVLFSQYLPYTEWSFHNGEKLAVKIGLRTKSGGHNQASLDGLFDISKKMEEQVSLLFSKYFVTVSDSVEGRAVRSRTKYPEIFEKKFSAQELKTFKKELYWLKIKFPGYCPPEILNNILCAINCFPVLNRRIHKINYKAQQTLNVIALDSADSFLTVKDVRNDSNKVYKGIPLAGLKELEVATYTIRSAINRLDQRQAREILNHLLELLQDESASFAAMGEDFLNSQILEMNQNIARLEQRLKKQSENKSSNPYMVLNALAQGETVFIEYWSSQGENANNIPSGSKVTLFSGSYLDNNSTWLMTTTKGGQEKPRGEQKINLLRKSLLSRDRIVTLEDIKIACWEALGNKARNIRVKKIFDAGKTPSVGFIRTILIEIVPLEVGNSSDDEWINTCEELKVSLESRSTANWPYKIEVKR